MRWFDVSGTCRTTGLIVIGRTKSRCHRGRIGRQSRREYFECRWIEQNTSRFLRTSSTGENRQGASRSQFTSRQQKEDNPNMNRTAHARARLTSAPVQTLLLIVVTVVGTWLALYRVPWQVSGDPCLLAAAASGVVVTCLWLTHWQGLHGLIFERNLLAGFLVAMPLVYV